MMKKEIGDEIVYELSIVIVTYNVQEYARKALASIADAWPREYAFEVIVVDNNSKDETVRKLEEMRVPFELRIVALAENVGFGSANNMGAKMARGKYVLFLNPDTVANGDAFDAMISALKKERGIGACGCQLRNQDGSLQVSHFGFPNIAKSAVHFLGAEGILDHRIVRGIGAVLAKTGARTFARYFTSNEPGYRVDYVVGACIMVPAKVFAEIGGFDSGYFMYHEEADLCFRINRAGYFVWFVRNCSIVHFGGQSTKQAEKSMAYYYSLSLIRYYRKNYGLGYGAMIYGIGVGAMLSRAIWGRVAGLLDNRPNGDKRQAEYILGRLLTLSAINDIMK